MSEVQRKTIIHPGLQAFVVDLIEHAKRGWEMDPDNAAKMWGFCHETGLVRTDKTVAATVEALEGDGEVPVKLTRAQILEKARAARGKGKAAAEDSAE